MFGELPFTGYLWIIYWVTPLLAMRSSKVGAKPDMLKHWAASIAAAASGQAHAFCHLPTFDVAQRICRS